MSLIRKRGSGGADLAPRVAALQEALDIGGHRLDPQLSRRGRQLVGKVSGRLALSGDRTVAALAGATGSGKSTLFNAICGAQLSEPGVRRPTTSTATAAIWDGPRAAGPPDDPSELLRWLAVPTWHRLVDPSGALGGLLLLDLPDHDSTQASHRAESDRLVELVDVFVWVTDPQKYADAALHQRYLSRLAGHDAVTIVVLNQIDRLTPEQVGSCVADLTRLLRADGLTTVRVQPVSAATGAGIAELRSTLADAVSRRTAAVERLSADVTDLARQLGDSVGSGEVDPQRLGRDSGLLAALGEVAGAPVVLDAVQAAQVRAGTGAVGWPFTRWLRRFRPDPLRRLRLGGAPGAAVGAVRGASAAVEHGKHVVGRAAAAAGRQWDAATGTPARTSLPAATPTALAHLELATRRLGDAAAADLPPLWADAVRAAAHPPQADLVDALDRVVGGVDLSMRRPVWWPLIGVLQWLLAVSAAAGLLWLGTLAVLGWLHVPAPHTPYLGAFPWPTVLLVGGAGIGLLVAALCRPMVRVGAVRRRQRAADRLDAAFDDLAQRRLLIPVQQVLADHRRTRQALARAAG